MDLRPLPVIVMVFIAIGLLVTAFVLVKELGTWAYNNAQPVLSVPAVVTGKRNETRLSGPKNHRRRITFYFATFEYDSADGERVRNELRLTGEQYGLLAEHDEGTLSYQGSRFQGFERGR